MTQILSITLRCKFNQNFPNEQHKCLLLKNSLRCSNAKKLYYLLIAQDGACSSSAYAAISKIIAQQAIVHRALCFVH